MLFFAQMKGVSLLFLVSFSPYFLSGQYEKILTDPTITWVAEIELILTPEQCESWPYDSFNTNNVLKSVSTDSENSKFCDPQTFSRHIDEVIYTEHWPIFADANLTQRLTTNECLDRITRANSVVTIDPATGEEILQLWSCPWQIADLRIFKVRQLLFYRDKTASFELITKAVAPLMPNGETLCWFAVPTNRKKYPKLTDPDIVWARRLTTSGATLDISTLQPLKQTTPSLLSNFIQHIRQDSTITVLKPDNWEVSYFNERDRLLGINQIDTVSEFNPETYQEQTVVVKSNLDIQSLRHLRLVQDWYWDDRRKRLIVKLVAVAPMVDVLDSNENFRFSKPLFYRKARK